jgi:ferric-dicitrate binding protein FerR (iron transport regulator)
MDIKKLERFYRGECSPREAEEVLGWFRSEELSPRQEQELYELWQEAEKEEHGRVFPQETASSILADLNRAIDERELVASKRSGESRSFFLPAGQRKWVLAAAAAVLLPVFFLWLFTDYSSAGGEAHVARLITVEAPAGSRETVLLEDGSRITLNAGGKVSYWERFPSHRREITLSGEAFFEVAKDSLRPFVVKTGPLSTQALGTSFNISHQPGEDGIYVALATGAVQVEHRGDGGTGSGVTRLAPGQQLVYGQSGRAYKIEGYDNLEVLGWREGILYFNKAGLDRVIERLERWYGVDIQIIGEGPGKEVEWHYTGTYDNQSLENVLEGISFVKRFSYERKGNKVIVKFN